MLKKNYLLLHDHRNRIEVTSFLFLPVFGLISSQNQLPQPSFIFLPKLGFQWHIKTAASTALPVFPSSSAPCLLNAACHFPCLSLCTKGTIYLGFPLFPVWVSLFASFNPQFREPPQRQVSPFYSEHTFLKILEAFWMGLRLEVDHYTHTLRYSSSLLILRQRYRNSLLKWDGRNRTVCLGVVFPQLLGSLMEAQWLV